MTIWKFPIDATTRQAVHLPKGAKVLSCQFQRDQLCLWAMVDPTEETERRLVWLIGTGNEVPSPPLTFVCTVQVMGGSLIFHVFVETN